MRKHSHAMENFSHFMVAMIIVILGVAAVAWAFTNFNAIGCAAGVPCHRDQAPHAVHY